MAFCVPVCAGPVRRGPRQGRDIRVCVATKARTSRTLLLRVVRQAKPARPQVVVDSRAIGRSVYVSRSVELVRAARRGRLAHALKASVPHKIFEELERLAVACEDASTSLSAAEAFGRAAPLSAGDEVSAPCEMVCHDSEWFD